LAVRILPIWQAPPPHRPTALKPGLGQRLADGAGDWLRRRFTLDASLSVPLNVILRGADGHAGLT
jgi:hypothetical protein